MHALAPRFASLAVAALAAVAPVHARGAEAATPAPAAPPPKFEMEKFQLVLLLRPADRKEIPEAEAAELQRQHLDHLGKMHQSGKMVIAGPFGAQRDESFRGACLYRVATPEEARALAEADPSVKAGRLRVEVITWYVGKGYMTFPKSPAPAETPR
jgi:uncharacterized protein YciI